MSNKLCFLVCEYFQRDVQAAIAQELAADGAGDVSVAAYPARCGRPPIQWEELARAPKHAIPCNQVEILGGCCLAKVDIPAHLQNSWRIHHLNQCFYLCADPMLVDSYLHRGAHLLTPGWTARWQERIAEWGFDRATARAFFAESTTRLVLLDTGVDPDSAGHLTEFAAFVNRPFEILPIGLGFLRLFLSKLILAWRMQRERQEAARTLNDARKQASEYAMATDLLNNLARTFTESEAIRNIIDMFTMLFAARDVFYLAVRNGHFDDFHQSFSAAPFNPDEIRQVLQTLPQAYAWMPSGRGFLLRIARHNETPGSASSDETVGVIGVDQIEFPEYKDHYLNLALNMVEMCGLAIENARTYQRILETEEELRRAQQAAEAASRAKSVFLANMSHELRTPLNGILGYAQILKRDSTLTDHQQNGVEVIRQSGEHLLTLINDILDLSKIEAERMELHPDNMGFLAFLHGLVDMIRVRAWEKELTFHYEPAATLPEVVYADEKRLRQVLLNLLSNAVKFTERGTVTFRVRSHRFSDVTRSAEALTTNLKFEIIDTGPGIAPDDLAELFLPFRQVGNPLKKAEGTGLGLAISRKLVRMMGGELCVESTVGQGSRFWFDVALPVIADVLTDTHYSAVQTVNGYTGVRRRVLVVDDNAFDRAILKEMLAPIGFEVVEAANGQEACEQVLAAPPDLILMDRTMPGMDGLEATREIRRAEEQQSRRAEGRRQKAEGGRQKAEGERQKAEGGRQKAEGGRQKAEGGRQKAEGGRQKAEGGRQETEKIDDLQSKISNPKSKISIIAVSANAFEHIRQESLAAGCDAFLAKPIESDTLFDLIQTYLKIEWSYAGTVNHEPLYEQASEEAMLPPPAEELATLFKLAQDGDIMGIQAQITHIEQLDARYAPFVRHARRLAQQFQIAKLNDFLAMYIQQIEKFLESSVGTTSV